MKQQEHQTAQSNAPAPNHEVNNTTNSILCQSGQLCGGRIKQPTDQEFLQVIFREQYLWCYVTGFSDDPNNISQNRRAKCWGGNFNCNTRLSPNENNYFTISIFGLQEGETRPRRRKSSFMATYVIVLDDVDEKIPVENAERLPLPTYKLQSSNGSAQWGYVLDVPCADREQVENLLDGLVHQGLAPSGKDPGMRGVTRYIRLPNSKNTKANRIVENGGIAPDVYLTEWNPDRKVSIEDLAKPFTVDLDALRSDSGGLSTLSDQPDHPIFDYPDIIKVKKGLGGGRYDITCPFVEEHTGAVDDGAAMFLKEDGGVGFKCHHGSCAHRTTRDFMRYIKEQSPMLDAKIMFKDVPPPDPGALMVPITVTQSEIDAGLAANIDILSVAKSTAVSNAGQLEFSFDEMVNRQVKTQWLIKGFFDQRSIILLFGETGSMKSFVAIDIGLCIATGKDWHGHAVKHSGPVFYICGEGFAGISKRLKAWQLKYNGGGDES